MRSPHKTPTQRVAVRLARSEEEGSCNGCTGHSTANGTAPHAVYVIDLRGCSVRVCYDCLHVLVAALSAEL